MNFRFRSHQRLKDAQLISYVFENGKKFHHYPLLFITADLPEVSDNTDHQIAPDRARDFPFKIAFSVPKRKVRKAVHRNRIKRLMRESYRLQQHNHKYSTASSSSSTVGVVAIFIGNEMSDYAAVYKAMKRFITQL